LGMVCCCFTSCFTGSSLLGMICIVSLHVSLVHHRWAWFVLFDYALHWFFITGYGLYCSTSHTASSLISMICIYHFNLHWFIITGHGFYCFTSCFSGSFLLGIVCNFSHPSLVHHC
jgi:hypothetical protein